MITRRTLLSMLATIGASPLAAMGFRPFFPTHDDNFSHELAMFDFLESKPLNLVANNDLNAFPFEIDCHTEPLLSSIINRIIESTGIYLSPLEASKSLLQKQLVLNNFIEFPVDCMTTTIEERLSYRLFAGEPLIEYKNPSLRFTKDIIIPAYAMGYDPGSHILMSSYNGREYISVPGWTFKPSLLMEEENEFPIVVYFGREMYPLQISESELAGITKLIRRTEERIEYLMLKSPIS